MEDFSSLVARSQNGDEDALRVLISRFESVVETQCSRFTDQFGGDLSRSDLLQEVWLRVWSRIHQFTGVADGQVSQMMFRKWLRQTARHVILNVLEARAADKRQPENGRTICGAESLPGTESSQSPSRIAGRLEAHEQVRQAIQELTDTDVRQVIDLFFFEGRSLWQISERLELSYDKVRHRFHRALHDLQRVLFDG